MENEVSNIFYLTIVFKKSNIFGKNGGKKFLGWQDHFLEEAVSYSKNEYNLFYRKLVAKYF